MDDKRKKIDNAYRRLFKTDDGKLVLDDLMKQCGFMKTASINDPLLMAYEVSKRDVYLYILRKMEKPL